MTQPSSGFLEFARSLQKPEIYNVIKNAEPHRHSCHINSAPICEFTMKSYLGFRKAFLVYGDALCSFNRVFGQGMTVACMELLALQECLAGTQGIAERFFRAASRSSTIRGKSPLVAIYKIRVSRVSAPRKCASSIGTSQSSSKPPNTTAFSRRSFWKLLI